LKTCNFGPHHPAKDGSLKLTTPLFQIDLSPSGRVFLLHRVDEETEVTFFFFFFFDLVGDRTGNVAQQVAAFREGCKVFARHLKDDLLNYTNSSIVVYAINPFTHPSSLKDVCDCLSILVDERQDLNVLFQVVPFEHLVRRDELANLTRELAFTTFTKIRRVSITGYPIGYRSKGGPGGSQQIPSSLEALPPKHAGVHEPPFLLCEPGVPNTSRATSFHCCYTITENSAWLVCTLTDGKGELLETRTYPHSESKQRELFQILWNTVSLIMERHTAGFTNVVIGKFGLLTISELEG
jgi:hypothetical protein